MAGEIADGGNLEADQSTDATGFRATEATRPTLGPDRTATPDPDRTATPDPGRNATPESGRNATPDPGRKGSVDRRARRRRFRQTVTFAMFFLLIVGIGLIAYAAYQGRIDLPISSGKPSPLPTCPPAPEPSVQAFGLTNVNVYNASDKNGLALQVARDLQKRGFKVPSQPANDPQKAKVTGAAVIRHGPKGLVAARTVGTVVAGAVTLVADQRAGEDVDLVLGSSFAFKSASATSTSRASVAPSAKATCQPVATASP